MSTLELGVITEIDKYSKLVSDNILPIQDDLSRRLLSEKVDKERILGYDMYREIGIIVQAILDALPEVPYVEVGFYVKEDRSFYTTNEYIKWGLAKKRGEAIPDLKSWAISIDRDPPEIQKFKPIKTIELPRKSNNQEPSKPDKVEICQDTLSFHQMIGPHFDMLINQRRFCLYNDLEYLDTLIKSGTSISGFTSGEEYLLYRLSQYGIKDLSDPRVNDVFWPNEYGHRFPIILGGSVVGIVGIAGHPRFIHGGGKKFNLKISEQAEDTLQLFANYVGFVLRHAVEADILKKDAETQRKLREELEETQQEVIQAMLSKERAETAADVLHEIKNTLTGIFPNVGLFYKWYEKSRSLIEEMIAEGNSLNVSKFEKRIQYVLSRGGKATKINGVTQKSFELLQRHYQAFKRIYRPEPEDLNYNTVLSDLVLIKGHRFKMKEVTIKEEYDSLPRVETTNDMWRVFNNLLANAYDAISERIDKEGEQIDRKVKIKTQNLKEAVRVCIYDTGIGVKEGDEERIFDYKYTTKPHSLGIGLSTCKSIVTKNRGNIWYQKSDIEGYETQFVIEIPKH